MRLDALNSARSPKTLIFTLRRASILYCRIQSILVLADGRGCNSRRFYVFKEALQSLVNEIGVEICIAHYAPYTSKWNPIEYCLFPRVTRAVEGIVLKNNNKNRLNLLANWNYKANPMGALVSKNWKLFRAHFLRVFLLSHECFFYNI